MAGYERLFRGILVFLRHKLPGRVIEAGGRETLLNPKATDFILKVTEGF